MRKMILLSFLLSLCAATGALAADAIDENYAICNGHRTKLPPGMEYLATRNPVVKWEDGWGHCETVEKLFVEKEARRREADESLNPELKKSRDFVREMQK